MPRPKRSAAKRVANYSNFFNDEDEGVKAPWTEPDLEEDDEEYKAPVSEDEKHEDEDDAMGEEGDIAMEEEQSESESNNVDMELSDQELIAVTSTPRRVKTYKPKIKPEVTTAFILAERKRYAETTNTSLFSTFGYNKIDIESKQIYSLLQRWLPVPASFAVPLRDIPLGQLELDPAITILQNGLKSQRATNITPNEAKVLLEVPQDDNDPSLTRICRLGVINSHLDEQKDFSLSRGSSLSMPSGHPQGYLLNCGGIITSVAFNQEPIEGYNYLAVSVMAYKEEQLQDPTNPEAMRASALTSYAATSQIQLWKVPLKQPDQPILAKVFVFDYGTAWDLSWNPSRIAVKGKQSDENLVGLLAACFHDGAVRILAVKRVPNSASTIYEKVESTIKEIRIPQLVPTSLSWIGDEKIGIAYDTGHVGIFELNWENEILTDDGNEGYQNNRMRPTILRRLHKSAISKLTTAILSNSVQLICTSSTDGHTMVTDLRNAGSTRASTRRSKLYSTDMVYSPHTQSFVSGGEDGYVSKLTFIRRYGQNIGRFVSSHFGSTVRCCACPQQAASAPMLLCGGSNGVLTMSNLVQKAFVGRRDKYKEKYQITSFTRVWTVERQPSSSKLRFIDYERLLPIDSRKISRIETTSHHVIITSLSWSGYTFEKGRATSNLFYAAGLGCGLVRIGCFA